jgi:hypothetical protein
LEPVVAVVPAEPAVAEPEDEPDDEPEEPMAGAELVAELEDIDPGLDAMAHGAGAGSGSGVAGGAPGTVVPTAGGMAGVTVAGPTGDVALEGWLGTTTPGFPGATVVAIGGTRILGCAGMVALPMTLPLASSASSVPAGNGLVAATDPGLAMCARATKPPTGAI